MQTVDQLLSFLSLLQQPAFCLRHDGQVVCNQAGKFLAPTGSDVLPQWLGSSAQLYTAWERQAPLTMAVSLYEQSYSVTVQALADGTLFLLTPGQTADTTLISTAQVLRQPLGKLADLAQRICDTLADFQDSYLLEEASDLNRQVYHLTRITSNLSDLELLRSGSYPVHPESLELNSFLSEFILELADLCDAANRTLLYTLPSSSLTLQADPILMERAILNLLSNAIKFSAPDQPIRFWLDSTATSVLLRMRSYAGTESDLLRTAFTRMEQRGMLPDPQWGLGLGLPLTRCIAQLHGGTVAVDINPEGFATVTMSIHRKHFSEAPHVRTPPYDYTGGMRRSLVELSEILPNECFSPAGL